MPQIQYSEKYYDDIYEYRYTLHPAFTRREPRKKITAISKFAVAAAQVFFPVVPIYGRFASGMTVWNAASTFIGTLARHLRP